MTIIALKKLRIFYAKLYLHTIKLYFGVVFTQLEQGLKMSYTYKYPHPAVTTDCVVFGFNGKALEILLVQRGIEPFKGAWAFPGGFMKMEETAEECAQRELKEETGFTVHSMKQLGAFTSLHRDPRERVVSIAFYALVQSSEVEGGDDAHEARWFSVDDAPPLAFDHDYILRKAIQQLRKDIHFEPVGFQLLNQAFTMSELQRLYEAILGMHFDRRNFEKKMLQTGILELYDEEMEDNEPDEAMLEMETEPCPYAKAGNQSVANWSQCQEENHFYGSKQVMKRKNINDLFGSSDSVVSASISFSDEADLPSDTKTARKKPGRKSRKFIFNKDRYNRFKQDNSFRLEF